MEKLNVPCVVQEIETPLGIVRVTDRTGKIIPMHVCRNGVDIDYPIPGTEENLQEVPVRRIPQRMGFVFSVLDELDEKIMFQLTWLKCSEEFPAREYEEAVAYWTL